MKRSLAGNAERGSNLLEFSLVLPWYIFLFVGIFDFAFYSYGLIATQNAARVAALYCSASSSRASNCASACGYALDQLRNLPNVGSALSTCTAAPVVVSATLATGQDAGAGAASVTVTYTSPQLIPIPGLLPGSVTFSRTVQMRVLT